MSFDLFVWDPPSAAVGDAEVVVRYARAMEDEEDAADAAAGESARLGAFLRDVYGRYPDLGGLSDDAVDASPWSSSEQRSDRWAVFNVRWSRAAQMRGFLCERAAAHGLVVLDPQEDAVLRPAAS